MVEKLREWMRQHGIGAYIFPSTDPHCGEYVPDHWQTRAWISGFNGSAGTAVVTLTDAALWTDSRYWLAAADVLQGTPFTLMKDGHPDTPSIIDWVATHLPVDCKRVGIDAWVNTETAVKKYRETFERKGIELVTDIEPTSELWVNRPSLPLNPIEIQPIHLTGRTLQEKLSLVRKEAEMGLGDALLIGQLDEIAWTLNLRGTDVHRTPVFVSYLLILDGITQNTPQALLFVDERKVTAEVAAYLQENHIEVRPYTDIHVEGSWRIFYEPDNINSGIIETLRNNACSQSSVLSSQSLTPHSSSLVPHPSPLPMLKAIKTEAEIAGYRAAMQREGVAMVKLLRWLVPAVQQGGVTECGVDAHLTALRSQQPFFRDLSFDTIAGYGTHAAIVHYEPTPESDIPLEPHGLFLLDCGAQYQDGTTDLTRTIPLGPLTKEERIDYTLVLKGHLRLSMVRFPEGSSGTQLDILARYAMWQAGKNYGHGTGHGIGSYLNCHEGPHQFRMNYMPAPLKANMTVTVEPGIYIAGSHGARTENTMLIVADGENEFGKWLRLDPLTLCPIPTSPIIREMMASDEITFLNDYHARVRREILPLLTDAADKEWLIKATEEI